MKRTQATGSYRRYRAKGCALQAARKNQPWTQEQVVGKLNRLNVVIDTRTYRRWEQGRSSMTGDQAKTLCTIFQQESHELGLREERAEDASHERSFSLEIENQPSPERADSLHAPDGQDGVKANSHVRTLSSPSALVAAAVPQSDVMVTFSQLPLPSSSVVRIAVLHISWEDLIDALRQKRDEQLSKLLPLSSPHDSPMHQDLILALIGIADQSIDK